MSDCTQPSGLWLGSIHACPLKSRRSTPNVTLYFGEYMTIVGNPKDELKTGTLHAMCKQLGIKKDEL